MAVTVKVNGTVNSLVHKGGSHFSSATLPDVCKTPTPGGPVPIPYPNLSQSSTLAKGTKTVKADHMMIAIKGSEFSLSNGDNPGTVGGVKSNTFMKESTWILYSFDVKMDGKNACRLTDKKFQNHQNTIDAMGAGGPPVTVPQITDKLCQDLCDHENGVQNGTHRRSSNDLEKQCQTSGGYGSDVLFRTRYPTPPGFSTKWTKPDAILVDVAGNKKQCFDFKLCGDRSRNDQVARQRALAGNKDPIIISCSECTNCNPSCTCP